jgi:hypothetical protein
MLRSWKDVIMQDADAQRHKCVYDHAWRTDPVGC